MTLKGGEVIATALVAAIVVPYVGYLVNGSMPFIREPREMAAVAVVLGYVAAAAAGPVAFRGTRGRIAGWIGVLAGPGGTALVVWAGSGLISEILLGALIGSIVLIWALAVPARKDHPAVPSTTGLDR